MIDPDRHIQDERPFHDRHALDEDRDDAEDLHPDQARELEERLADRFGHRPRNDDR